MTAGSTDNTMEWQDKKRRLWLMGLVFPTLIITVTPFIWGMNQLGWYPASQVLFWIGPILLYVVMPTLDLRFVEPRNATRRYSASSDLSERY